MALPAPNLDDRTFQDIVDETKRLIPRYCPEWTNHNLSDPGVALIELFAWMSEMMLFRMNQVPDRLYTKFLDMVGIQPFPPSVARADLTFWLSTSLDHPVVVPSGTEVGTAIGSVGDPVVFSTSEDLVIAPPRLISAKTGTARNDGLLVDAWDDLRLPDSEVTCFTSDPIEPDDAFYLGFAETLGGALIRLSVAATIEGIGVDPADPPIRWEVWSGETWLAAQVQGDTTGGLNRDGFVVLALPRVMEALSMGGTRAFWLRGRLVRPRADQPSYQTSPRISSLRVDTLGGTVVAEHAVIVGQEAVGRSDGTPDQFFSLRRSPVLPRREGEAVRVVTVTNGAEWTEVEDFTASGPDDRHYVLDGASGEIRFGPTVRYPDGSVRQHGAIPPDGAEIVMTSYRHGGGSAGNVGANTLVSLRSGIAYIDRVANLGPASGGVDAETVRNAKIRGPFSLRSGQRAVTVRDFERLTLEASTEVARVRCLPPAGPSSSVRLLVVPHARNTPDQQRIDDFALDPVLYQRIRDYLEPRRMLGATVDIGTPFYQGVTVAALIQALPGRPAALVRQRALNLLYRYINPLTGGTDGDGWAFDTDLNAAPIAEMLEGIEGVDRVEEVLLFAYDLRTDQRIGAGREVIRLDRQSLFLSARHQVVVR
ncbi:MAG TPA: putative baseplate assembly protein [Acidimicrobiales bacterium]|nr:putative baseplate assembly protein [Acidimicrobiales bacterium]